MKMELRINGKLVVVEAEGALSVQVRDAAQVQNEKEVVRSEAKVIRVPAVAPAPVVSENMPVSNDDLFAQLVCLRKELAVSANVPPYVIFQDKALRDMVEKLPQDLTEFGNIIGVGQSKLEKYGEIFLSVIKKAAA